MARYIDADKLEDGSFAEVTSEYQQGWNDALYAASISLPTADVEEVKHGRWISNEFGRVYICSECGRKETTNTEPYCHCGAKMDGGIHND